MSPGPFRICFGELMVLLRGVRIAETPQEPGEAFVGFAGSSG